MFSPQPTFCLQTVEINNTDAEGRLVLADGVAYAARYETLKKSHTYNKTSLIAASALYQFLAVQDSSIGDIVSQSVSE